ncbi:MAG: hypothetical protein GY801_23775 [bacterium]|nr:hypothetical protein [bacterium]
MIAYQAAGIIYENPPASVQDIQNRRMEGSGVTTFPSGRIRILRHLASNRW